MAVFSGSRLGRCVGVRSSGVGRLYSGIMRGIFEVCDDFEWIKRNLPFGRCSRELNEFQGDVGSEHFITDFLVNIIEVNITNCLEFI